MKIKFLTVSKNKPVPRLVAGFLVVLAVIAFFYVADPPDERKAVLTPPESPKVEGTPESEADERDGVGSKEQACSASAELSAILKKIEAAKNAISQLPQQTSSGMETYLHYSEETLSALAKQNDVYAQFSLGEFYARRYWEGFYLHLRGPQRLEAEPRELRLLADMAVSWHINAFKNGVDESAEKILLLTPACEHSKCRIPKQDMLRYAHQRMFWKMLAESSQIRLAAMDGNRLEPQARWLVPEEMIGPKKKNYYNHIDVTSLIDEAEQYIVEVNANRSRIGVRPYINGADLIRLAGVSLPIQSNKCREAKKKDESPR